MDSVRSELAANSQVNNKRESACREKTAIFFTRTAKVLAVVCIFILSLFLFPVVGVIRAVEQYNEYIEKKPEERCIAVVLAIRHFFLPVPFVGSIVYGISRCIYKKDNEAACGMDSDYSTAAEVFAYVPLLNSGLHGMHALFYLGMHERALDL